MGQPRAWKIDPLAITSGKQEFIGMDVYILGFLLVYLCVIITMGIMQILATTTLPNFVNMLTGVGTIGLALATVYLAWTGNRQLAVMEDDQRPWIAVDVKPVGPFVFYPDGGGALPVTITPSNLGKSPAFNIEPAAWGYLKADDINQEQRKRCELLRNRKQTRDDIANLSVVFPGQTTPWHEHAGNIAAFFSAEQFRKNHHTVHGKEVLGFWVFGCVDYTFGEPKKHHQTGFIYRVGRTDGNVFSFDIEPPGEIPAENLRFVTFPYATGRID
jgi:hypothetical protein